MYAAHVVPSWYKALFPVIGGTPVPDWTLNDTLSFMAGQGIQRSIISFSTPGPNVFVGNKVLTVALARILNEAAAAYCRAYPGTFHFYAQVPLPYTQEAIREAQYAINTLGAVGIWVQSNAEGQYLGNTAFTPFFQALNNFGGRQILYVHPAVPVLKVNNNFIDANPTPYVDGKIEF
jgi:predicted TIM-barrel fold metal-dependent hydrolase